MFKDFIIFKKYKKINFLTDKFFENFIKFKIFENNL